MIIVLFIQSGDDTTANTSRLCLKAARPVRKDLLLVSTIPFDLIYQCDHNFPFPLISLNPKGNGDGRRWNHMWSCVRLSKQGCGMCWGTEKVITWKYCFKYLFSTFVSLSEIVHLNGPGTRPTTFQWLPWRPASQADRCLFLQGFRWNWRCLSYFSSPLRLFEVF